MSEKHFNLVTEPWIKVIDDQNQEREESMEELFTNTAHYRQLAGEMKAQDLAILRFLLAILTTVYSRYDADDQPYDWLKLDEQMRPASFDEDAFDSEWHHIEDELLNTWHKLYRTGHFSKVVLQYLHKYSKHFDLFDEEVPFYQVTKEQYDSIVPQNKVVAKGKGTVAVKQMNRTISESNNKPDIFSPKTPIHKDDISPEALVRWLITYQNFTAVTDKTKITAKEKFSVSKGWLYGLDPVFVVGNNLFDTLILNLIVVPQNSEFSEKLINQRPVWEFSTMDYIQVRRDDHFPQNLAQLYTVWSRAIHIEWNNDRPQIFSAGLPKLSSEENFLEPMTTWKQDKKTKEYKPNLRWINSLGKAMWRNFGQYVRINTSGSASGDREPGIVTWLNVLKRRKFIRRDLPLHLMTVGLINDGNATSQSPAAEFADEMQINADVLFDENKTKRNFWPKRIEDTVELTDKIGSLVWHFANNAGNLRGLNDPGSFAGRVSARFFEQLNQPFYEWLAGLTNNDERDEKVNNWKKTVDRIASSTAKELLNSATPLEIRGKDKDDQLINIFVYYRIFRASVAKTLDLGGKKNDGKN